MKSCPQCQAYLAAIQGAVVTLEAWAERLGVDPCNNNYYSNAKDASVGLLNHSMLSNDSLKAELDHWKDLATDALGDCGALRYLVSELENQLKQWQQKAVAAEGWIKRWGKRSEYVPLARLFVEANKAKRQYRRRLETAQKAYTRLRESHEESYAAGFVARVALVAAKDYVGQNGFGWNQEEVLEQIDGALTALSGGQKACPKSK